MRFRNVYMIIGSMLVLFLMIASDPDGGLVQNLPIGGVTVSALVSIAVGVLYVAFLHLSRRALFDYLDLEALFTKALETPTGSALAIIGIALAMIAISLVIIASKLA